MSWWLIAIILGVLAPWVIMGGAISTAFRERGPLIGFGVWSGSCILTVPLMLLIMWIGQMLL